MLHGALKNKTLEDVPELAGALHDEAHDLFDALAAGYGEGSGYDIGIGGMAVAFGDRHRHRVWVCQRFGERHVGMELF